MLQTQETKQGEIVAQLAWPLTGDRFEGFSNSNVRVIRVTTVHAITTTSFAIGSTRTPRIVPLDYINNHSN